MIARSLRAAVMVGAGLLLGCGTQAAGEPDAEADAGGHDASAERTPPPDAAVTFVYGSGPAVLTHHNDRERTGAQTQESVLTPSALATGDFGLAFSRKVQGMIYGQPLFVPKIDVGGKVRDVVFVATEHNVAYAFDAEDPRETAPLWSVDFGPSIPSTDFDADQGTPYRDIVPELGITSTPVIDLKRAAIYVFAQTKENGEYVNRIHRLSLRGNGIRSTTVTIQAPGIGAGSTNGVVTIPPKFVLQRPALAFSDDWLWVAGGGHGDFGPYHGWMYVTTWDLFGAPVALTTPSGWAGGIWQSGGGPASTGSARAMYVETGNGSYDDAKSPADLSESFLRFDAAAICPEGACTLDACSVGDSFTPHDHDALDLADQDLGSSGPMIIPKTNVIVGGGKQGKLYVLDRTKLGGRTSDDAQILQSFAATTGELFAGLVYWDGPTGPRVYVAGQGDTVKAYRYVPNGSVGTFETSPWLASTWTVPTGTPGAGMSLTSDGAKVGSGVLWVLTQSTSNDGSWVPGDATLRAFDADDLTRELWSSARRAEDAVGRYVKFTVPTVSGGRVFVPSVDVLRVYARRAP